MMDNMTIPSELIYRITLPDYATPSFVTAEKYYFCGEEALEKYCVICDTDAAPTDKIPAEVLWEKESKVEPFFSKHTNIWGFNYIMQAERFVGHHLWLRCSGKYYRCVKPHFSSLTYHVEPDTLPPKSIHTGFLPWGPSHVIEIEGEECYSRFYEVECVFDSHEAAQKDMQSFDGAPILDSFFDDIFGDG